MASDLQTEPRPGLAQLAGEILGDVQKLLHQEVKLAKREMQAEWDKTKAAGMLMAGGLAFASLAGLLLVFALAHVLAEYTALSLSGAYAIMGVVLALIAGGLFYAGRQQAEEVKGYPERAVEEIQQTVEEVSDAVTGEGGNDRTATHPARNR